MSFPPNSLGKVADTFNVAHPGIHPKFTRHSGLWKGTFFFCNMHYKLSKPEKIGCVEKVYFCNNKQIYDDVKIIGTPVVLPFGGVSIGVKEVSHRLINNTK